MIPHHGVRSNQLVTAEGLPSMPLPKLKKTIHCVTHLYQCCGFDLILGMADWQFDELREEFKGMALNITAAKDHVPKIECKIRAIKERILAIMSALPFQHLPAHVIIELINFCILWMNVIPSKMGCSMNFSLRTIMMCTSLDFKKHCKASFGAYCQVYNDTNLHNSMTKRTVDCICLGLNNNVQGSYKFFNLATQKKIVHGQFKAILMPKFII